MDRSLFPENVEVRAPDLRFEAEQRAFHTLVRFRDYGQMGVAEGLQVTPNATQPTTIDVAAGRAYTPKGDLVELAQGAQQVQLADPGAFEQNYILLEYSESETFPGPDELTGEPRNRRAVRASTLRVLTPEAYDALSEEQQSNLALVAIINGSGGTDLLEEVHFFELGAIEPVIGAESSDPAIEVVSITPDHDDIPSTSLQYNSDGGYFNFEGTLTVDPTAGTLTYEAGTGLIVFSPPLFGFQFTQEPAGTPVSYNTLLDTQIITVPSSTPEKSIEVRVNGSMLRHLTAPYSIAIRTYLFYRRRAGSASSVDREHRRQGGLAPTPNDPHGVDTANRTVRALSFQTAQGTRNVPRRYDRVTVNNAATDVQWIPISEQGGPNTPGVREYIGGSITQVGRMRTFNARVNAAGVWTKDLPNAPAIREITLVSRTDIPTQVSVEATGPADTNWAFIQNWRSDLGDDDPMDELVLGGTNGLYSDTPNASIRKNLDVNGRIRAWEMLVGDSDDFVRLLPGLLTVDEDGNGITTIAGGNITCGTISANVITQTGGGGGSTGTGSLTETVFDLSFSMTVPAGGAPQYVTQNAPPSGNHQVSTPNTTFGTQSVNGTNVTITLLSADASGYEFQLNNLADAIDDAECVVVVEAGGHAATCRRLNNDHYILEMKPAPSTQFYTWEQRDTFNTLIGRFIIARTAGTTVPVRLVGLTV